MASTWLSASLSLALAGLAALAGAASQGYVDGALAPICAAPLLLFGAALPVLLRWTPVEPSVLKLGLFACLLSPPLLTLLNLGLGSWSRALWVVAGLQVVGLGRRCRFERLGRAGWLTLGLSALVALWLVWVLLLGGWGPRLGGDAQVWNAMAAEVILRGGGLENPVLAGTPFPAHPGFAALTATVAGGLGLTSGQAAAALTVWAAATLPVAIMLLAAPLWSEVRRVALAPLLALTCGLCGAPLGALGLSEVARQDPTLTIGAGAVGLALCAGAWLAAAHAVRHGRRPWVGLFAVSGGAAALVHPTLGAAALTAPVLAALVRPGAPGVRGLVALAALTAALPGLWMVRRFGLEPLPFAGDDAPLTLVGIAPLLLLAGYGFFDRQRATGREGVALRTLLVTGALLPLGLAALGSSAELSRLSSFALAPLAAGGLVRALGRPVPALVALLLVLPGLWDTAVRLRGQARAASAPFQVRLEGGGLGPSAPGPEELEGTGLLSMEIVSTPQEIERARLLRRRHRGQAYRWIREHREALGEDAVLWRSVAGEGDRGTGPLGLHLAGLYAGLPLWCDADPASGAGSPRWEPRRERLAGLFEQDSGYDPNTLLELQQLGRPAVFLVEEADREATSRGKYRPYRGVDLELERLGAERKHVIGTASVYYWRPR